MISVNNRLVSFIHPLLRNIKILRRNTVNDSISSTSSESCGFAEDASDKNIVALDDREYIDHKYSVNHEMDRVLPKTNEEFNGRKQLPNVSPCDSKLLTVAVIGMPNAGKSTLVNQLVGTRVSSTSKKVHTTRKNIIGIMQENLTQVVFVDTPGLVTSEHCRKHSLEQTFVSHPDQGSRIADLILVVIDASNNRERQSLNPGIIDKLRKHKEKQSVLVINKVDAVGSKRRLIDISTRLCLGQINGVPLPDVNVDKYLTPPTRIQEHRRLHKIEERIRNKGHVVDIEGIVSTMEEPEMESKPVGWNNFDNVFMVSALDGEGVDDLKDYLITKAVPKEWSYNPGLITPLPPSQIVYNTVREKLLENLPHEIPYLVSMQIQSWDVTRSGTIAICLDIYAPKSRYMAMILGPGGKTIKQISEESRSALSDSFKTDVVIQLVVKNRDKKSQAHDKVPKNSKIK